MSFRPDTLTPRDPRKQLQCAGDVTVTKSGTHYHLTVSEWTDGSDGTEPRKVTTTATFTDDQLVVALFDMERLRRAK